MSWHLKILVPIDKFALTVHDTESDVRNHAIYPKAKRMSEKCWFGSTVIHKKCNDRTYRERFASKPDVEFETKTSSGIHPWARLQPCLPSIVDIMVWMQLSQSRCSMQIHCNDSYEHVHVLETNKLSSESERIKTNTNGMERSQSNVAWWHFS